MRRALFEYALVLSLVLGTTLTGLRVAHAQDSAHELGSAHSPTARPRRALIAAINLSIMTSRRGVRFLYQLEENNAARMTRRLIRNHYDRGSVLTLQQATFENFVRELESATKDPNIDVVDVLIDLHGLSAQDAGEPAICFISPDSLCMPSRKVLESLQQRLSPAEKTKLRAFYSDACWGSEQMEDWLAAGFRVVNGSARTDQNKSLDIRRWMKSWASGASYGAAIDHANGHWLSSIFDRIGKGNSTKQTAGDISITIDSP